MLKSLPSRIVILPVLLLLFSASLPAATPPDNAIPIIGMRANSINGLNWGIGDDASELWLSIRSGCPFIPGIPIDVRIGWFRLEESAQ